MGSKSMVGTFAALGLVTLSGCAEESGAVVPSVTSSPSATVASPTSTELAGRVGVPDEAKKHTRAGAESFIRYYFDMVNVAWTVPQPSAAEGFGEETCDFCDAMVKQARDMEARGERYDANPLIIGAMGPLPGAGPNDEFFTVRVLEPVAHRIDHRGGQVAGQSREEYVAHIGVTWAHSQWSIIEVEDPEK